MKKYNKLVRDLVPEIIQAKGESVLYHRATDEEFEQKLRGKVLEEVQEVLGVMSDSARLVEELADLQEVIWAIMELEGITPEQVEEVRKEKKIARGGFDNRIILDEA